MMLYSHQDFAQINGFMDTSIQSKRNSILTGLIAYNPSSLTWVVPSVVIKEAKASTSYFAEVKVD